MSFLDLPAPNSNLTDGDSAFYAFFFDKNAFKPILFFFDDFNSAF
jgi:hypothetical protein